MQEGLTIEIKARYANLDRAEALLKAMGAKHVSEDEQLDTCFNSSEGNLMLRKGEVENKLIHYKRNSTDCAEVVVEKVAPENHLLDVLKTSLGVKVEVQKKRIVYAWEDIRFHLDDVKGLGQFVEVIVYEAEEKQHLERIKNQCWSMLEELGIKRGDILTQSYADMLISRLASVDMLSNERPENFELL